MTARTLTGRALAVAGLALIGLLGGVAPAGATSDLGPYDTGTLYVSEIDPTTGAIGTVRPRVDGGWGYRPDAVDGYLGKIYLNSAGNILPIEFTTAPTVQTVGGVTTITWTWADPAVQQNVSITASLTISGNFLTFHYEKSGAWAAMVSLGVASRFSVTEIPNATFFVNNPTASSMTFGGPAPDQEALQVWWPTSANDMTTYLGILDYDVCGYADAKAGAWVQAGLLPGVVGTSYEPFVGDPCLSAEAVDLTAGAVSTDVVIARTTASDPIWEKVLAGLGTTWGAEVTGLPAGVTATVSVVDGEVVVHLGGTASANGTSTAARRLFETPDGWQPQGGATADIAVRVTGGSTGSTGGKGSGSLAATGSDGQLAGLAALLLAGGALVLTGRRLARR